MDDFEELGGYEKGVIARALLQSLIKQGFLAETPDDERRFEIVIPADRWQLELLGRFSEDEGDVLPLTEQHPELARMALKKADAPVRPGRSSFGRR